MENQPYLLLAREEGTPIASERFAFWRRLTANKPAVAGLVFVTLLILVAIFATFIADYNMKVIAQDVTNRLSPPSLGHWFGTDGYGRDIFARMVYGTRVTLFIAFSTIIVAIVIGGFLGIATAYYGGLFDSIVMRIVDTIMCLPNLLLTLAIVAALGTGMNNLIIALSFGMIPYFVRIIRSTALSIVSMDYIEAARSLGTSNFKVITRHIVPNVLGFVIVQATLNLSYMIMISAGLSFIGLGVQPPAPEWGAMLSEGREYMRDAVHVVAFPGLIIMLTAVSFNVLGDGLRDALDPRQKNE